MRQFFEERNLLPAIHETSAGRHFVAGAYELIVGDAFALDADVLAGCAAVYDRAALIALPPDLRLRYRDTVYASLPTGCQGLLITLEYPQAEKAGPLSDAEDAAKLAAMQEHWRLLYVAMTRAEEALFIGGSLGPKEKAPADDSWYARLAPLFEGEELTDPVWNWRKEWGERAAPLVPDDSVVAGEAAAPALPGWATTPIGPEPRPPRPLAPSSAGEDAGAAPPLCL